MNDYPQIHTQLDELHARYPGQRCGIWVEYDKWGVREYTARVENAFGSGPTIKDALERLVPLIRSKEQLHADRIRALELELEQVKSKGVR